MISVLCPTYGRPELLEETIECFLRQSVADSELVVLNDRADQRLLFDHPRVRIVNSQVRYPSLGDKRNALADQAAGDVLTWWDDDDIYLPDHLDTVARLMPLFRSKRVARTWTMWYDQGRDKYRLTPAAYMHTLLIEKSFFNECGRFQPVTQNEDHRFVVRLLRAGKLHGPPPVKFQHLAPTFILRAETGREHVSDSPPGDGNDAFRLARITEEVDRIGRSGDIALVPQWRQDYAAKAAASWEAVQACRP